MKPVSFILFSLLMAEAHGQISINKIYNSNDSYYSKTDFSLIDTLKYWSYKLDLLSNNENTDSIKPIGRILFWRIKTLTYLSNEISKDEWRPKMEFNIYELKDSSYCLHKSVLIRILSSCIPPEVGGDAFSIGNYIFLNTSVCLNCLKKDGKRDFCRPTINYIFSKVNPAKIKSLGDITKQFPIMPGSASE
jgi:hypothetical protein